MSDWRGYVRERLSLPRLRPERQAEIVEDLAQQLEDADKAAMESGVAPRVTETEARREIQGGERLAREITPSGTRNLLCPGKRTLEGLETGAAALSGGSRLSPATQALRLGMESAADMLHGLRLL